MSCLQQPVLGQATAGYTELNSGLPLGCQGPGYLNHHLLHPRMCISKKLDLGHPPRNAHTDKGLPSNVPITMPNVCLYIHLFLLLLLHPFLPLLSSSSPPSPSSSYSCLKSQNTTECFPVWQLVCPYPILECLGDNPSSTSNPAYLLRPTLRGSR